MNKITISGFMTCCILLAGLDTVSAQDDEMRIIPVEMYACSYNDRKGSGDLDRVIAKWNTWMDKQGIKDYAAWTLTPYYFGQGANAGFDVLWLGAGKDAVALGKAQDTWLANGGALQKEFEQVWACDGHSNYASLNFKPPPEGATPANSIMTFSDCSYKKGASFAQLGAAMADWAKHLSSGGSNAGVWHWYPVYGGGGEKFSFKWIEAFKNLADLGADYESYGNGRGFVQYGRLFGHVLECDSARAYVAKNHRFVQLR